MQSLYQTANAQETDRKSALRIVGEQVVLVGEQVVLIGEQVVLVGEQIVLIGEQVVLVGEQIVLVGEQVVYRAIKTPSPTPITSHCVGLRALESRL